jgi:hypothetical protein
MMDDSEIAAAQEFEAAQARGEYFPERWFDRLALYDAYRMLLHRLIVVATKAGAASAERSA